MAKYHGPKRGILDLLDMLIGRVSDSDTTAPGKRKRSWGATFMMFCMLPAFLLVLAVSFQVVYSSVRAPAFVTDHGNTTKNQKTGTKTRTRSVKVASPSNYIDWPIVTLAGLILVIGVGFALIRHEQDLTRALQIGGMVAEIKNGTSNLSQSTHAVLEATLQDSITKVSGGDTKAPENPDDIPFAPIADEWADRQKKK